MKRKAWIIIVISLIILIASCASSRPRAMITPNINSPANISRQTATPNPLENKSPENNNPDNQLHQVQNKVKLDREEKSSEKQPESSGKNELELAWKMPALIQLKSEDPQIKAFFNDYKSDIEFINKAEAYLNQFESKAVDYLNFLADQLNEEEQSEEQIKASRLEEAFKKTRLLLEDYFISLKTSQQTNGQFYLVLSANPEKEEARRFCQDQQENLAFFNRALQDLYQVPQNLAGVGRRAGIYQNQAKGLETDQPTLKKELQEIQETCKQVPSRVEFILKGSYRLLSRIKRL